MAIPSGSGSEVLKRVTTSGDHDTAKTILTVSALHICTILSITICNNSASNAETFYLFFEDASNSGSGLYITRATPLAADATFVWNDKFVLYPGDVLKLTSNGTSDIMTLTSYIDQDWS